MCRGHSTSLFASGIHTAGSGHSRRGLLLFSDFSRNGGWAPKLQCYWQSDKARYIYIYIEWDINGIYNLGMGQVRLLLILQPKHSWFSQKPSISVWYINMLLIFHSISIWHPIKLPLNGFMNMTHSYESTMFVPVKLGSEIFLIVGRKE